MLLIAILVFLFCIAMGPWGWLVLIVGTVGLWLSDRPTQRERTSSESDYYPRCKGESTRFAYDSQGNRYDIEDGSFSQGMDGRYYGPSLDEDGVVIETDYYGDLHIV